MLYLKLSKNRKKELKYFCLQYNEWKKLYSEYCQSREGSLVRVSEIKSKESKTETYGINRADLRNNIDLIEHTVKRLPKSVSIYIFRAVTEGYTYKRLCKEYDIPISEKEFKAAYERFFQMLHDEKGF